MVFRESVMIPDAVTFAKYKVPFSWSLRHCSMHAWSKELLYGVASIEPLRGAWAQTQEHSCTVFDKGQRIADMSRRERECYEWFRMLCAVRDDYTHPFRQDNHFVPSLNKACSVQTLRGSPPQCRKLSHTQVQT